MPLDDERVEPVAVAYHEARNATSEPSFRRPWAELTQTEQRYFRDAAIRFLAMLDAANRFPPKPPPEGR